MGDQELTREEVDRFPGPVLLEFGTGWCGYCRAFAPQLAAMLAQFPAVRYIKIEDGKGKPLGRSFKVKLWPTFVFLRDGRVVKQLAHPERQEVWQGLEDIT
jgi:thioredoxin 1